MLASLGLLDNVTFAFWNVFGRNLAGISKVTSRPGRDHWGNHNVSVMVGKNFKSSVVGGVAPLASGTIGVSSGSLAASDIDSTTGAATAAPISPRQNHTSPTRAPWASRSVCPPISSMATSNASAGGKVVKAALNGVG